MRRALATCALLGAIAAGCAETPHVLDAGLDASEPIRLAAGEGFSFRSWMPARPATPDGCCWWVEVSARPAGTVGDPAGAAAAPLRVDLADADGVDDAEVRRAVCRAWVEAPPDREVVIAGTVRVELVSGTRVIATEERALEAEVPPSGSLELVSSRPAAVDAGVGERVTCAVHFST